MEIKLTALADFASLTREGKLNILGVFDEINPPVLPFTLPQMFVVVAYDASPVESGSDKESRVVLLDADGSEIITLEQTLRIPPSKRPGTRVRFNQVLGLAGLKFIRSGDYQFSFLVDGDEKATLGLRVNDPPNREGGESNAES